MKRIGFQTFLVKKNYPKIDIITLTGGIYKIYVTYSDTIKTVKDKLQLKTGIPWYQSKLIFGGKRMLNHRKLFHYRVPIGGTVHIVLNVFMKIILTKI